MRDQINAAVWTIRDLFQIHFLKWIIPNFWMVVYICFHCIMQFFWLYEWMLPVEGTSDDPTGSNRASIKKWTSQ